MVQLRLKSYCEKVVVLMEGKHKRNPIFARIVMNLIVLLLVLLLNNFTAIFAFQIEEEMSLMIEPEIRFTAEQLLNKELISMQDSLIEVYNKYRDERMEDLREEDVGMTTEIEAYAKPEKEEPWPERVVFLTFDDGPSWNTSALLDILYAENAPSTFFLLGESILTQSEMYTQALMERMVAEGHYIGLHSMTHVFSTLYLGYGASGRFVDEMIQLQELIYDLVGHQTNLCRAPYGMMSGFTPTSGHAEAIAEVGIQCIDWNVDPQDWRSGASAQLILEYVINQVEMMAYPSELVIVLHEHNVTVEALPAIIAYLREQGYVFKAYQPGHEFIYRQYNYRLH